MNKFFALFFYALLSFGASPECEKNSDCVLRPAKCCSCNQGGKLKAFAKNMPMPDCADQMCAQMISKDKSCQAKRAVCLKQRCELMF
ncbi:MAG: hypothetical protein WCK49_03910 [Myxococcaceae bacterium]